MKILSIAALLMSSIAYGQTTSGLPSPVATSSTPGSIQPDGTTTTISSSGILSSVSSTPSTPQYVAPQAIAGCGVEYVSGLTYTVGACNYSINGVTYNSVLSNITLATADPTNPRIDVIYVDTTQVVQKITGTPGATPQQPVVDPSTQLQLTFVLVPATATTPSNTTVTTIYAEGTEWTGSVGGTNSARVNLTSTNNPYLGTHDTEFGNGGTVTTTTFAQYTKPSAGTENLSNYNALVFYMRNKAAWPNSRSVTVQWYNGATPTGIAVVLSNGAFGFNARTNTTGYQQVSIPASTFGIPGVSVTSVRFTVSGTGSALTGFYLDQVTLQGGNGGVVLPSTLMNFKGAWSSSATYNPNDLITSSNIGYVSLATNTNQAVSNATYWSPLASTGGGVGPSGVRNITASTYTILSTDSNKLLTFTPTAGSTVTLPAATTTGFTNAVFYVTNTGIGQININPVTSNISGLTQIQLQPAQTATLFSDGTNYQIYAAFINFGTNMEFAGGAIPWAVLSSGIAHNVTATGWGSLASLSNGTWRSNSAYGTSALTSDIDGGDNAAFGVNALQLLQHSGGNTALGNGAWQALNGGGNNTAVGWGSGSGVTATSFSVAVGYQAALGAITGSEWVCIGENCMSSATGGGQSIAIGPFALNSTTTANNTAVGAFALQNASSGSSLDAFGWQALIADTTGSGNDAFGQRSLNSLTTGSNNTAIGVNSGYNSGTPLTTISNSTFVGQGANASTDGLTNMIVIGQAAQGTASNQTTIGNGSVTQVVINGTGNGCLVSISGVVTGNGTPCTSSKFVSRGRTSALTTTTILTTAATSLYRVSASVNCDTSASLATVTLTIAYTDPSNTAQTISPSAAVCTTLGSASVASITQSFSALTGTVITVAAAIANTPNYDIAATVEQLTSN